MHTSMLKQARCQVSSRGKPRTTHRTALRLELAQVPKQTLYPMSFVNVAFDRTLIGPAMYEGLRMEDRSVDDLLAGFCAKV